MRFDSFLSGGFTTMSVINPPDKNWQNASLCINLSWAENYNFSSITVDNLFNFSAQDSKDSNLAHFLSLIKLYDKKLFLFSKPYFLENLLTPNMDYFHELLIYKTNFSGLYYLFTLMLSSTYNFSNIKNKPVKNMGNFQQIILKSLPIFNPLNFSGFHTSSRSQLPFRVYL